MKMTFDQNRIAEIQAALEQSFLESMELLGRKFTQTITSNIWDWPSGQSPRDIVDQGRLRDSQDLSFPELNVAEFTWNVEYAAAVHEGAKFKNGTTLPPRRWTEYAINEFDLEAVFTTLFQHYAASVLVE